MLRMGEQEHSRVMTLCKSPVPHLRSRVTRHEAAQPAAPTVSAISAPRPPNGLSCSAAQGREHAGCPGTRVAWDRLILSMKLSPNLALFVLLSTAPAAAAHHHATHTTSSPAPELTADAVNRATPVGAGADNPSLIVKAEVLLDRRHFSPGAIDSKNGDQAEHKIGPVFRLRCTIGSSALRRH
jgi:hypothetical protein